MSSGGQRGTTYHVTYPMMHVILPTPPSPVNKQMPVKNYLPTTTVAGGNKTICTK